MLALVLVLVSLTARCAAYEEVGWERTHDQHLLDMMDWCHLYSCVIKPKINLYYTHTMCVYPDKRSEYCLGDRRTARKLRPNERKFVLDMHNKMRQKVATGREKTNYSQPTAANMLQLVYNLESELIAERWAKQCRILVPYVAPTNDADESETKPPTPTWFDDCRDLMDGTSCNQLAGHAYVKYSENISPSNSNVIPALQVLFHKFYNKINDYNNADFIHNFTGYASPYAYAQINFAHTSSVGCAVLEDRVDMKEDQLPIYIYCNYCPDIVPGKSVYLAGRPPCSACPKGLKCSTEYPGLCKQDLPLKGVFVRAKAPTKSASSILFLAPFHFLFWITCVK